MINKSDIKGTEVKLKPEMLERLLEFCAVPCSCKEMHKFCGIKLEKCFRENIIKPMIKAKKIAYTNPNKPKSSNQKCIAIK